MFTLYRHQLRVKLVQNKSPFYPSLSNASSFPIYLSVRFSLFPHVRPDIVAVRQGRPDSRHQTIETIFVITSHANSMIIKENTQLVGIPDTRADNVYFILFYLFNLKLSVHIMLGQVTRFLSSVSFVSALYKEET